MSITEHQLSSTGENRLGKEHGLDGKYLLT